jgi:hypothetical protein
MVVMTGLSGAFAVMALFALIEPAIVTAPQPAEAVAQANAPTQLMRDTMVRITVERTLQSDQIAPGDRFPIRLAVPVVIDGRELLPAGLIGEGEVIDTKKSGGGGAAGGIVTNARFLMCGTVRVPVGKMHLNAGGKDHAALSAAVSSGFGVFGMLVKGKNAVIPQGSTADAKIIADTVVDVPCVAPAPVAASQ